MVRLIGWMAALLLVGAGLGAPGWAAEPAPPAAAAVGTAPAAPAAISASGRPRIGLVLGGGGAKGFAHIGVIEELERRHIPVDAISGTSMGAVVGSMYAIGNDAGEIKTIAREIDWKTIFNDRQRREDLSFRRKREVRDILLNARLRVDNGRPVLPTGILGGQRLFATVQELLAPWRATEDFDTLPIPFRAVAADIVTGKPVVMGSGSLPTAVFASMSIPAAFPPVEREGLLLVDGGIADNLPVDAARAMGVDIVIVVDVGEPPATADRIGSALSVFNQMQLLLGYDAIRRQRESLAGRDVLIEPDITGFGVTAFDRLEEGIDRGRAAAQKMGDKLQGLAVNDAQWAAYLAERQSRANPAPVRIARVEINNTSKLPTEQVAPLLTVQPGDVLDGAVMKRDVERIFALDAFDRVDYRVDLAPDGNTLVVNAQGVRGAQRYFQGGLLLSSNFGKSATFDLAVAYTDRDFLGTGAEWRGFARVGTDVLLDVSLFKPIGRWFVEPTAYFSRDAALVTQVGSTQTIDALQVSRAGAGVDGGIIFGNWGELRVGTRLGGVDPEDGNERLETSQGWQRDVDWRVGFTVDTLDSLTFPTSGTFAQVQFVDHVTALGGQFTRDNFTVNIQQPLSLGRGTLVLGGRLATSTNVTNDFIGDFRLGGFLNGSGLTRNALIGQQLLFGRAVGYYRISDKSPIMDLPVYVGGSLEAGNVWEDRDEISLGRLRPAFSLFVAAATPIGPLWLAYGNSRGDGSIYLVLGRVF